MTDKGDFKVGADRLLSEYNHLIDGKRLALVSNHTGRLSNGIHLADLLHNYPNAELSVLFGMYHNIRILDYYLPRDEQKPLMKKQGLLNIPCTLIFINLPKRCLVILI